MRAVFNGITIAQSDDTIVVEGNHYFPLESLDPAHPYPRIRKIKDRVAFWNGVRVLPD